MIVSISVSKRKGTRKTPVTEAVLIKDHGLQGDAHSGPGHRQVSLLAAERIQEVQRNGIRVSFGGFAENIATHGVDWRAVPVGTTVKLGDSVLVQITQIGKTCHRKCAIYHQTGDCIMPREGVFARVLRGGLIRSGDGVSILHDFLNREASPQNPGPSDEAWETP